jgi:transcriptional regulator with XRE-family HTH domain
MLPFRQLFFFKTPKNIDLSETIWYIVIITNKVVLKMTEIGMRIRAKREALGITQEELAKMLGYKNKSTIAKIENGVNDITQSKVLEFAAALHTTVAYLMGWDDVAPSNDFSLSDLEKQIIIAFRKSDEISKAMVLRALSIDEVVSKGESAKMA